MRIRSRVIVRDNHHGDHAFESNGDHLTTSCKNATRSLCGFENLSKIFKSHSILSHNSNFDSNRCSCDDFMSHHQGEAKTMFHDTLSISSYLHHVKDLLYIRPIVVPSNIKAHWNPPSGGGSQSYVKDLCNNMFILWTNDILLQYSPSDISSKYDTFHDFTSSDFFTEQSKDPLEKKKWSPSSLCHDLRMIPSDAHSTLTLLSKRDVDMSRSAKHCNSSMVQQLIHLPFLDSQDSSVSRFPCLLVPFHDFICSDTPSSRCKRRQAKKMDSPRQNDIHRSPSSSWTDTWCDPHRAIFIVSQQIMKSFLREWNLEGRVDMDRNMYKNRSTAFRRNTDNDSTNATVKKNLLQMYLQHKKLNSKQDKFFRQSLRIVENSNLLSCWSHSSNQFRQKKMLCDVDLYIRMDIPCPVTNTDNMLHAECPFQVNMFDQFMLNTLSDLKHQWCTCKINMISYRRNVIYKSKKMDPLQQENSRQQNQDPLSLHEFIERVFPVQYKSVHRDHALLLDNIYHQEDDIMILPFLLGVDPSLPKRTSDSSVLTEQFLFDLEGTIGPMTQSFPQTFIRQSITSRKRIKHYADAESGVVVPTKSPRNPIPQQDEHILNGMHIMGLNRIMERCRIVHGLFLSLPSNDIIRKDEEFFRLIYSSIRMPSFFDDLFPASKRKLRIIPKILPVDVVASKNESTTWIPNVTSFIKEQNCSDVCNMHNPDVMLTMDGYENMLLNDSSIAIKGELMHLLSKSIEWNASNWSTFTSTPSLLDKFSGLATNHLLENDQIKLPLGCQTDSQQKRALKKQRKEERKKRRKRDAQDDRRSETKRRKKEKIDEISNNHLGDEASDENVEQNQKWLTEFDNNKMIRTANNDGTTTISVPKLHVGVTPMIMTRKTYSVQTTVTEQVMFACDSSPEDDMKNHTSPRKDLVSSQKCHREIRSISSKLNESAKYPHDHESRQIENNRMTNMGLKNNVAGVTPPSCTRIPLSSAVPRSRNPVRYSTYTSDDYPTASHSPKSNHVDSDNYQLSSGVYNDYMDHNRSVFSDHFTNIQHDSCNYPLVLCSERFLEQASPAAANLSSGMWLSALYEDDTEQNLNPEVSETVKSREVGQRFTLYDCGLVDKCGVDFDLGDGRAVKIFFPGDVSEISTKDFMRHMVHVSASGRYRCIHLFFVLDLDAILLSPPTSDNYYVKDLCMIQNALVRQQGSQCENMRVHHMTRATLSFHLGRLFMSLLSSNRVVPFSKNNDRSCPSTPLSMDVDMIQRGNFLLHLAPSMNAYECIMLIERTKSYSFADVLRNIIRSDDDNNFDGIKAISRYQVEICLKSRLGMSHQGW